MRRREFLTMFVATAAWPSTALLQSGMMRRVAVLQGLPENDPAGRAEVDAFRQGLQDLGWSEGQNVRIEYRWPGGSIERARSAAKEIVALNPDVIMSRSTPATAALLGETRTIPIVFVQVADPVFSGFVKSLARPGGNVTGFTNVEGSMGSKWLELLKEASPGLKRVAVMFNPATAPYYHSFLHPVEAAAPAFGLQTSAVPVHNVADIDHALHALATQPAGGLVAIPDTFLVEHRHQIIELTTRLRIPAVYSNRVFTPSGGLMNYAVDTLDLFRRTAAYVDRIMRGTATPAELPVQQPTKFQLSINLRAAKAINLELTPTLLARADEVIE